MSASRPSFSRPVLSIIFYVLAVLVFAGYFLFGLGFLGGAKSNVNPSFDGLMALSGVSMIAAGLLCAILLAAIGYVIELLAKIEWNTRASTDGTGYVGSPASGAMPPMADKQYFLSEKGRVTGPLNAAELLALYRDGRISIAAQISVEEGGQRRLLKNLSEIGFG